VLLRRLYHFSGLKIKASRSILFLDTVFNSLLRAPSKTGKLVLVALESKKMNHEARLAELHLELPPAPKPKGVYKPVVTLGNLAYVSGHGPLKPDGSLIRGRVGADLDLAAGKHAARQVGLTILATLRNELGDLNRVQRVIKVLGMVNCTAEFGDHPQVINGCSELFAEVFGSDNGIGARSAVGMGSLPGNIAVEVEAIFELA
jgi:enamine deaminase RidA (YjgF/YER057c/UK114 family)